MDQMDSGKAKSWAKLVKYTGVLIYTVTDFFMKRNIQPSPPNLVSTYLLHHNVRKNTFRDYWRPVFLCMESFWHVCASSH